MNEIKIIEMYLVESVLNKGAYILIAKAEGGKAYTISQGSHYYREITEKHSNGTKRTSE